MDFELHIEPGEPVVLGVNRQFSGLLDVSIPVEPRPPGEWWEIFNGPMLGSAFSLRMDPPKGSVSTIQIRPPDAEIEKYVAHVCERVKAANEHYNRDIAPRLRRAYEERVRADADYTRRIEAAQERLKKRA